MSNPLHPDAIYAILSSRAYFDTRDPANWLALPAGWTELTQFQTRGSGVNGDPALQG